MSLIGMIALFLWAVILIKMLILIKRQYQLNFVNPIFVSIFVKRWREMETFSEVGCRMGFCAEYWTLRKNNYI